MAHLKAFKNIGAITTCLSRLHGPILLILQLNCCGIALDTTSSPWVAWKMNTKVNSGDADSKVKTQI